MLREIPIFIVDAFSDKPFQGNPAAVCLLDQDLPDETMQNIAFEMNLSETVFISKLKASDSFKESSKFCLRWFTPTNEVDLCGHATVAASKIIFSCGNSNSKLSFKCASGTVGSSLQEDGTIVLDFPNRAPNKVEEKEVEKMTQFIQAVACGCKVVDVQLSAVSRKLLVRLDDSVTRSQLESLTPPIAQLHQSKYVDINGLILTVKAGEHYLDDQGEQYDFFSRYFAPWLGIDEDPVCGSAHSVLIPYWSEVLGKTELYARQCSRRSGELRLKLRDDGRVNIGGKARITLKGNFLVNVN